MERCFIATEESKWLKDYNSYLEKAKQQREFVNKFFEEKGIDGESYLLGGDGFVNQPFEKWEEKNITLSVEPTENNLNKFGRMLNKANKHGVCKFRKNSSVNTELAQRCVDEKIVINLYEPDIRDYFKELRWNRCGYQAFLYKDTWYIKIESEFLKEDDTPEGFKEIKLSEYYKIKEKREETKSKEE